MPFSKECEAALAGQPRVQNGASLVTGQANKVERRTRFPPDLAFHAVLQGRRRCRALHVLFVKENKQSDFSIAL